MTNYFGRKIVDLSGNPQSYSASDMADVIVTMADGTVHRYLPFNDNERGNVSGRHSYRLHENGALEITLTMFEPSGTVRPNNLGETLTSTPKRVRVYSPLAFVYVEGQANGAPDPEWRSGDESVPPLS